MKIPRPDFLLLSPLILVCAASAQDVDVNFTSLGTSEITFNGSTSQLSFAPDSTSGFDFQIASSDIPALVGYRGDITGTFSIGPVLTYSIGPEQVQLANVTGSGELTISDGTPNQFSATIDWNTVSMLGTGGILDSIGAPNLSDFSYHGTNQALLVLAQQYVGLASATFQFVPPESLDGLAKGNSTNSTTYSGSFEAIPEPKSAAAVLGGSVLLAAALSRRWRGKTTLFGPAIASE